MPLRLAVASFSSRTANLTWGRPYNGRSEITSFLVEYKKAKGKQSNPYSM